MYIISFHGWQKATNGSRHSWVMSITGEDIFMQHSVCCLSIAPKQKQAMQLHLPGLYCIFAFVPFNAYWDSEAAVSCQDPQRSLPSFLDMESTPQSQGTLLVYTFTCFFFALFSWCPSCKCECIWEKTDILRRGRLANFGRLRGLIVISSDMHTETRHQKSDSVFALAGRKVPTILTSSQRSDFFPQILRMERNLKNHNLYTFCPRWQ